MAVNVERLLEMIKKVQMDDDHEVYIDYDDLSLTTVAELNAKRIILSVAKHKRFLESEINYLQRSGFIEIYDNPNLCKLTHEGWSHKSQKRKDFWLFLLKSVAVPSIVAFITAFITSLVT